MKTFEDYSRSPDGWNVTATLDLEDDGRFSYSEGWTDYTNASLSGGAAGTWRRVEEAIIFHVESVNPPIYFPWVVGQELPAILRDGALEFERGWKLRPPTQQPERIIRTPFSNAGSKTLILIVEPWGIRHELAPGQRVEVVAKGNGPKGEPEIEWGSDEVVYYGLSGTSVSIVQQSPLPPQAPRTEAERSSAPPAVESPVVPACQDPAKVTAPAFVPRALSPELASLIRRWVDELVVHPGSSVNRLCKENNGIQLHCERFDLWVLTADGRVLCIDHDSFAQRPEPVTDPEEAYSMIAIGARTHPELLELLPPERREPVGA